MKVVNWCMSCIFFLVLMDLGAKGEDNINVFIEDIITTFSLTSPTIVYNSEEAPDICHKAQWVLCLHPGMPSWYPEDDTKKLANESGEVKCNFKCQNI